MAKLTLASFASLQSGSAVTALNNNFATIITAFENTLSRDGTSPNSMSDNLDMNSNRISNLVPAIGDTEPVRLKEFQDGMDALEVIVQDIASTTQGYLNTVTTIYDNFDDRYLGPKASDPSVDNDGDALLTGALYWNTSTNITKVWTGTQWTGVISTTSGFMLDDLGDVIISSASSGDVLRHDGSSWVDYASSNFLARANHTGTQLLATVSDVTITSTNLNTLDDGVNTTLHYHDADRARAVHTGTQLASTISDFTEASQDAVGAMVDATLVYTDSTPLLSRAALTGAITATGGSNTTALGSFTIAQLNTAISDADVSATTHTHVLTAGATDVSITAANLNALDDGVNTALHYHDSDRSRSNHTGTQLLSTISDVSITSTNLNTLDDGANTSLHFHNTDRDRANHTGTQTASTISDFSEAVDDRVSALVVAGTNMTITYNDAANTLTFDASSGGGSGLSDGDYGDVTVSGSGTTISVDNDAITFAKMQNIATSRLLGRNTASTGDVEEIQVIGGLEFSGGGAIQRSALTGDVTASTASNTTTIANDAVTYAKMQDVSATSRVLGRKTAGAGDVEELTGDDVRALFEGTAPLTSDIVTSSTSFVDATGCSFTADANTTYIVQVFGTFQSAATTTGVGIGLKIPSGAITGGAYVHLANVTLAHVQQRADDAILGNSTGVATVNVNMPVHGWWLVRVEGTGGTVQLRWRGETATATTLKAPAVGEAGTYMTWKKVA